MDEFRFSKGIARWTSDFTPSAEEDVSDPDTKLLLRFDQAENHKIKYSSSGDLLGVKLHGVPDGIDGSRDFIESVNKGYSITNYGNVQIDTDKAKFGNASALFMEAEIIWPALAALTLIWGQAILPLKPG